MESQPRVICGEMAEDTALAELRTDLKQLLRENQHLQKEVEDMRRVNDRAAELLNPLREVEPLREAEPVPTVDMPPAPPCPSPCQRRATMKRIRQD